VKNIKNKMGCGDSNSMSYTAQYCSLEPIISKENEFTINLITEERIPKTEGIKLIYQLEKSNVPEIKKFLERPNLKTKTIFYYYISGKPPLLNNYNQSLKYIPSELSMLKKVIILSLDSAPDIPSQLIENEMKHIGYDKLIGHQFNFNNIKNKLDIAHNPNITNDSLSLSDESMISEDESVKEKPEEIIINEEITDETYNHVVSKFNNEPNDNDTPHLETANDNNYIKGNNGNKNSSKIKLIKICGAKIESFDDFCEIIKFFVDKKILKFSFFENNTSQDFEGWGIIFYFLEHNYSLRYIDLHSCNLYDSHLISLTKALIDKRIRFLNLSENFLTMEGSETLAKFLQYNKTIQKLNLSRNAQTQFKSEGVQIITEALVSSPNIKFLDFSYMNITGCGQYIGDFISKNKSIENIALRSALLNAIDFKNIFVPLKSNRTLKEIDVSMNDMGGDKSLQYIADAIKENNTLNSLKIDNININNDNYLIIFDAIEKNKNIKNYTVNYNSKLKPIIMLNFFIKQKQVKYLEYEPFDKDNPEDKKKELTLEEKKMMAKFKTERADMKFVYK
jgi:hypothetical protein